MNQIGKWVVLPTNKSAITSKNTLKVLEDERYVELSNNQMNQHAKHGICNGMDRNAKVDYTMR